MPRHKQHNTAQSSCTTYAEVSYFGVRTIDEMIELLNALASLDFYNLLKSSLQILVSGFTHLQEDEQHICHALQPLLKNDTCDNNVVYNAIYISYMYIPGVSV